MAANPTENPLKSQKSKFNDQKAKRTVAPFAFLFSIVLYVSIFYFFSFSPSTLITDNKFWFFISNTLVLIIAADYCAFSSSKDKKRDFYEEYSLHSHATRKTLLEKSLSATGNTSDIVEKGIPVEENDVTETVNEIPEKILEVVKIEPVPECRHSTLSSVQTVGMSQKRCDTDNKTYCDHHLVIDEETIEPKTIRQSKSEKVKHINDKEEGILHRSNTTKAHQEQGEPSVEHEHEHDKFSAMSNEELNRRVEEFIEKFNRQMRLQV